MGIAIEAKIVHGAVSDAKGVALFEPGEGKTQWFKDIDIGPEMVIVPAGEFLMGSEEVSNQWPVHSVKIGNPFAVSRFAITFDEWDAATAILSELHVPGDEGWGRGRRPVINVSRDDAQAYCLWLSKTTAKKYRLLTEAEWEYCCRAGSTTKYAFGGSISAQQAQCSEGASKSAKQSVPVGSFSPNNWGLFDTHGNVWEWCEDAWYPDYYDAPSDGSARQARVMRVGVIRGGCWSLHPELIGSAFRILSQHYIRSHSGGFRVAREL